jgi:hypothetical protein
MKIWHHRGDKRKFTEGPEGDTETSVPVLLWKVQEKLGGGVLVVGGGGGDNLRVIDAVNALHEMYILWQKFRNFLADLIFTTLHKNQFSPINFITGSQYDRNHRVYSLRALVTQST